ncbi:MAG: OmpA family protein [Elusimicrobiota bacterium]|nr:OmpA family protein [Elusimicrobiota bacterium]
MKKILFMVFALCFTVALNAKCPCGKVCKNAKPNKAKTERSIKNYKDAKVVKRNGKRQASCYMMTNDTWKPFFACKDKEDNRHCCKPSNCKKVAKPEPVKQVAQQPAPKPQPVANTAPAKAPEQRMAVGKTVTIENGNFAPARADLTPGLANYLQGKTQELKSLNYTSVSIIGHTDSIGSVATNQALSEKRAKVVADFFRDNGIPASKIKYGGKGSTMPIASNKTAEGRAKNRRVEITVK